MAQVLKSKNRQKGDQFLCQMSDFCWTRHSFLKTQKLVFEEWAYIVLKSMSIICPIWADWFLTIQMHEFDYNLACDIIKLTHLFSFLYVRTCNSAYSIHPIFRYYDFIKDFWLINVLFFSSSTSFEMNPEVKGTCAKETWPQPMYIPFTVKGCSERDFTTRTRRAMIFFKHSQALWRAPCCFGTNSYMI